MAGEQWIRKGIEFPMSEPSQHIGKFLLERLRGHGNKILLTDGLTNATVSASQLLARSISIALELRERDIGPGDVVSSALDNSLDVSSILLGVAYVGAAYAPVNPDLHQDDMRHVLGLLQPKMALCAPRALAKVRASLPEGSGACTVAVSQGDADWEAFLSHPESAAARFQADADVDLDSPLCILCSSGTTGAPKGVVLSHRCWHYLIQSFGKSFIDVPPEVLAKDKLLKITPDFWVSGFLGNIMCAATGIPIVILARFDVDLVLSAVQKHRITNLTMSPPHVAAIAKHPDVEQYDTSSLRTVVYGGAALSPALQTLAGRKLRQDIIRFYGLTECPLVALPGPKSPREPSTVGLAAPNVSIKIVDSETTKVVGPNTEGEICIKSRLTFSGYYKNSAATADMVDEEGWVHTGDMGYFDEDGYLYICDRYKELIKYKGILMSPVEVESLLTEHEAVKDAAVVGIEHEEDQEHPVGFAVLQAGKSVQEEELLQMLRDQLPVYKQLHGGIHFVEVIPRTPTGKIKRRELRQRARELRDQQS